MQKIFALLLAAAIMFTAKAQNTFKTIIKDKDTKQALTGVSVVVNSNKTGTFTNDTGFAELTSISNGEHQISFSITGYETQIKGFNFPLSIADTVEILLEAQEEELNEVIVQSTRTSRTIKNTPTRIETIDGEELDEKNNMRPSNVTMLLHESTGIQVQQTSATSGNASIRLQGLDGRYTQLLKDGYPNFGNFASGLSLLEIPPLDLLQIEVIKGPASTLYGAGAIAGVVNFISKSPKEKFQGDFLFNQSNIGQTNIGGYISEMKGRFGYSLMAVYNIQKPYDVDKDEFSEIPESNNFTINPRLFYNINQSTSLMIGNSFTKGNNTGGDMLVMDGKADSLHTYFEKNQSTRNTTTFELKKKFANKNSIELSESVTSFNRQINTPGYEFAGLNTNSYTDLSYAFFKQNHTSIAGINIVYDKFKQKSIDTLNAQSFTAGAYMQDTWDISNRVQVESGLRIDNVSYKNINYSKNQTFVLPRIFALFKITDKITSRLGGGLGYKIPTIFTEQTESMQYKNVLPLDSVTAEKSIGGTFDINFSKKIGGDLLFSINQLFFYTQINHPLVLQLNSAGMYYFANMPKPVTSHGFETNLKFIFKDNLKLFLGYTFTNARAGYLPGNPALPLVPKNKLNLTLMYEKEDNFKLGLESYLTGRQYLYNGLQTPSFWELGFMAQKTFKKISVFINFENFTDERQSNYKPVVNPPHNNPTFDDIWNHTEGFVFNGGIKLKI